MEIRADIAGTVWKITVTVGQHVGEDDTVVILESMKMEIPVVSQGSGVVKEILVHEGQLVAEGEVLVLLG